MPREKTEDAYELFADHGLKRYADLDMGLAQRGWRSVRSLDSAVVCERRHFPGTFAVAKIKSRVLMPEIWNEYNVLRGLNHRHIIAILEIFAVQREQSVVMLFEFADVGTLQQEIDRLTRFDEDGGRFYLKQICSGVRYMHQKEIRHQHLNTHNVLLKSKRDGTNSALLSDFSMALLMDRHMISHDHGRFRYDVNGVRFIGRAMMDVDNEDDVSEPCRHMLDTFRVPMRKIDDLLAHPWFNGPAVCPSQVLPAHADEVEEEKPKSLLQRLSHPFRRRRRHSSSSVGVQDRPRSPAAAAAAAPGASGRPHLVRRRSSLVDRMRDLGSGVLGSRPRTPIAPQSAVIQSVLKEIEEARQHTDSGCDISC